MNQTSVLYPFKVIHVALHTDQDKLTGRHSIFESFDTVFHKYIFYFPINYNEKIRTDSQLAITTLPNTNNFHYSIKGKNKY